MLKYDYIWPYAVYVTTVTTDLWPASLKNRPLPTSLPVFAITSGANAAGSTHESDRRKAQKVADLLEGIARRKIAARKIRKTVLELCREVAGDELAFETVKEYCQRFLDQKKREIKANSHELYQKAVAKLLAFLGPLADEDINDVTKQDIVGWRDFNATKVSVVTVNSDLKIARALFRSARRDGVLEVDPCEFVAVLKKEANALERRPFTLEEIRRLLEVCDPEWRSLVLFGLYTGQRLGDLASLTWNAIDTVRDELHICSRKLGKRMVIPLAEALKEHILALPTPETADAPVHPRAYSILQRDGRVRELSSQFSDILAAAGLRAKLPHSARGNGRDGKRESLDLSFHCLRHSAASMLRDAGVSEAVTMELIGHSSVAISRHYSHVGHEAKQKAVQALPRL